MCCRIFVLIAISGRLMAENGSLERYILMIGDFPVESLWKLLELAGNFLIGLKAPLTIDDAALTFASKNVPVYRDEIARVMSFFLLESKLDLV